jgi:hypothetical protein
MFDALNGRDWLETLAAYILVQKLSCKSYLQFGNVVYA